ncbi:MAG: hypothetical protein ACRCVT_14040, partial [Leadbetterella sp.]
MRSFLWLLLLSFGYAQGQWVLDPSYKSKITQSLQNASNHAANACFDPLGRAKGDYELVSGKWSPYETAWHTGQLIHGLLQANQILQSKKIEQQCIQSGNWWCSLQIKQGKLKGYLRAIHGAEVGEYINTTTITDGT